MTSKTSDVGLPKSYSTIPANFLVPLELEMKNETSQKTSIATKNLALRAASSENNLKARNIRRSLSIGFTRPFDVAKSSVVITTQEPSQNFVIKLTNEAGLPVKQDTLSTSVQNIRNNESVFTSEELQLKIMEVADEIYKTPQLFKDLEKLQAFCGEKKLSLEDFFTNPKAFNTLIKNDMIRRILFLYINEKRKESSKKSAEEFLELYALKKRIEEFSIERVIKLLDEYSSTLEAKDILLGVQWSIPYTITMCDFVEIPAVKSWMEKTSNGKKIKETLNAAFRPTSLVPAAEEEIKKEMRGTNQNLKPEPAPSKNNLSARRIRPDMSIGFRNSKTPGNSENSPVAPRENSLLARTGKVSTQKGLAPAGLKPCIDSKKENSDKINEALGKCLSIIEPQTSIVPSKLFEESFKEAGKILKVGKGEMKFASGEFDIISREIGSSLLIGTLCYDHEGKVIARGVGNFDENDIIQFNYSPREPGKIKDLIDKSFEKGNKVAVFLTGMYSEKHLRVLHERLRVSYNFVKILALVNPWKIPEISDQPEPQKLEQYLQIYGFHLKVGVNKEGVIFAANDSCERIEITKFSHKDYECWLASLQKDDDFKLTLAHQVKLVETAKDIYKNRELYTKELGTEKLQEFCKIRELSLEEILKNPIAFDVLITSDTLRWVLFSYVSEKIEECTKTSIVGRFGLYVTLIEKMEEFAIAKILKILNANLALEPKEIVRKIKCIFPTAISMPEFVEKPAVKLWFATANGKIIKDRFNVFYGGTL